MVEKRRGIGRGIGALIPNSSNQLGTSATSSPRRPADVFFSPSDPGVVEDIGIETHAVTTNSEGKVQVDSIAKDIYAHDMRGEDASVEVKSESTDAELAIKKNDSTTKNRRGRKARRVSVPDVLGKSRKNNVSRETLKKETTYDYPVDRKDADKKPSPITQAVIDAGSRSKINTNASMEVESSLREDVSNEAQLQTRLPNLNGMSVEESFVNGIEDKNTEDNDTENKKSDFYESQPQENAALKIDSQARKINLQVNADENNESLEEHQETGDGLDNLSDTVDVPELVPVPGAQYAELEIDLLAPNLQQPRTIFDDDDINELASSIKEVGVLQPVVVRVLSDTHVQTAVEKRNDALINDIDLDSNLDLDKLPSPKYEIIMGERRWRAARRAGLFVIPAVIRTTGDADILRDAILENLHRVNINPLEEAAAYRQLLDDFNCTQEEISQRIARSRPQISNTIRLLQLPPIVQKRVAAGVISAGHARALLGLETSEAMEKLAQRITAEGISVRNVEEIVSLGSEEVIPTSRAKKNLALIDPEIREITARLKDHLDTSVSVTLSKRKGKLQIGFADINDLQRIVKLILS